MSSKTRALIDTFDAKTQSTSRTTDPFDGLLRSSVARRKLEMLASAGKITDLEAPPGNRLEALKGDRHGQHSIRVNDQWRLCFRWDDGAHDVEILDYH